MDIDALPAVTPSAGSASDVESAICARRPLSPASGGGGGGGDNFDGDTRWADLLNCCSCGEELCDGPLLLACLHVSCRKCFNAAANAVGNGCGGDGDRVTAAARRVALCAACQRDSATAAAPAAAASEGNADEPLDNFLVESLVRARRMRTGVAACGFCNGDGDVSCGGGGGGEGEGNGKSKRSGAAAAHWCVDCARYMCNRCFLFHGRFNAAHLVFTPGGVGGASSPLTQPLLPVLCRQHGGSVCSLYCCRCERLLCRECSQRCLADAHDVVRVGGEQAAVAARRLADELRDACGKLEEKARRLAELSGGGDEGGTRAAAAAAAELDEARRRDLATQDENFRLALDMVDEAYREALAALDKLDEGGAKAVGDRKEAASEKKEDAASAAEKKAEEDEEERLLRSLEHALEFTAALLDPADGGGGGMELLQFHEPAERRLRALCDRADRFLVAAATEAPSAAVSTQQPKATEATPERRVVIECHQPSNFGDVALNWIGVPRQQMPVGDYGVDHCSNEPSPTVGGSDSLALQLRNASTSSASSANAVVAAANSAAAAADDRPRVLHFGNARRRVDVPFARALGMSVSADGNVLVAASLDGVVEYDAEAGVSGRELGRWLPPPELGDDVRAVECLEDGRVAVAIAASQAAADAPSPSAAASTLVLLGKPDDGGVGGCAPPWGEERRLALRCRVLRLAACGETLAVLGIATHLPESGASAAADDRGREVDLLCTYDWQLLLSRTLDYAVCAVALTARAVVLASAGRRDADFGGSGLGGEYSLEAYSYDWAPLWRRDYTYPVRDVCPQPLGYVLYISCGSDDGDGDGGCCFAMKTVVAVSAEDGGYLCDLVHEPSAEGDAAAADGAILAYDGLRAQLALMPRVGCGGATSLVAVVELRPATAFK